MCMTPMKIKGVRQGSPSMLFVPCGHCDQCRRIEKSGWSFRLGLELQKKIDEGFDIGFCTLTYNDEHLPHIPFECFRYGYEYKPLPCFDKNQMRKFIRNLRTRLFDDFGVTGLVYFLGSEFGERRGRPHYHLLVCYPPKKINYRQMHALIVDLWHENGYIFPETPEGGRKYEDGEALPFKVDTSIGAYLCAKYVTKYVCKDVSFFRSFGDVSIVDRENQGLKVPKFNLFGVLETEKDGSPKYESSYQVFLRCRPFHLQSRSLGWSYFQNMSVNDKLTVLESGVKFLGEERRQKLPVYIKNKLIFDNKYILKYDKNGEEKRMVLREANAFFMDNADKIYKLKCKGYAALFESFREPTYWGTRKAPRYVYDFAMSAYTYFVNKYNLSAEQVAQCFLTYYKVPYKFCYDYNLTLVWLQRYNDRITFLNVPLIPKEFKHDIDKVISSIFYCASFLSTDDDEMTKNVTAYKQRKKERCLENVRN